MAEDLDFKDVAPKSMHIEQTDKETVHLLVFLFMQFLASPQQAETPENKDSAAYSGMKRSLHGLFSLLGYDEKEQRFTTMPHKIRLMENVPRRCAINTREGTNAHLSQLSIRTKNAFSQTSFNVIA